MRRFVISWHISQIRKELMRNRVFRICGIWPATSLFYVKWRDMKEELINDICITLGKACPDLNLGTARNVLELTLDGYDIRKIQTELVVYDGDPTDKIIKSFLVAKKVNGASDKTIKHYAYILHCFFGKTLKQVESLTANDIRIYFARRELEDGVSAVTRNNERAILNSFFQWMVDEELLDRNPMRKVKKIKEKKEQKKAFTQMEVEKIRANCSNERESAIVEILISTGCRVSELCGIRIDEINGDSVIVHGKGDKDRTCYLTARAQLAIKEYLNSNYCVKRRKLGSPYLFMGKNFDGNEYMHPIAAGSIESITRRLGKDAGVEKCYPHRFRRTCATMALNRGMPIEQVSMMLGHESIETTQIYLDLTEESLKSAHKKYVV